LSLFLRDNPVGGVISFPTTGARASGMQPLTLPLRIPLGRHAVF
jgi:hypothetical protein